MIIRIGRIIFAVSSALDGGGIKRHRIEFFGTFVYCLTIPNAPAAVHASSGAFFMSGLKRIKLAAFICAFKAWRRNSMWYAHDRAYKVGKALGMAESTVRSYLATAHKLGLLQGGRFINLHKCMDLIFAGHAHLKHVHFFAGFDKVPSLKYYYTRLKFAFAELNYRQQAYRIERNKILDDLTTDRIQTGNFKRIRAMMKQYNVSTIAALYRTVARTKDIVSGKYHVARILDCSPSTGSALLRIWSRMNLIGRRVTIDFIHAQQCNGAMQGLIQSGFRYCYPDRKGEGFYLNRGSVITLKPAPSL